jgi:glucose 1-dehydrogenase
MKGLAGKIALITGASMGIGRACAIRLVEEGAHVVINHRKSAAEAEETLSEVRKYSDKSLIVQADVAQEADVVRMFDTALTAMGGIDMLINNAGFLFAAESDKLSMEDFDRVMNTNLRGAFMCAQKALQHWLAAGKAGVIVNMSSVHQTIPKPTFVHYAISKGGMQNMTTTLALEYANRGIRVNAVAPGATITPLNDGWANDPAARAAVERHIPMGRSGEAWEMAAAAAFLCSDEAAYITGQTIYVDGGLTLYNDFRENWST